MATENQHQEEEQKTATKEGASAGSGEGKSGESKTDSSSLAPQLGEILVEKRLVSKDQVEIALQEQRKTDGKTKMLGAIMVELGFITESALGEVLAESSGVCHVDLQTTALDPKLIMRVPKEVAMRCKTLPVSMTDNAVFVATADIYNIVVLDQLRKFFPKHLKIMPVYAPESQILELIDQYYHYEMSIDGILREIETGISESNQQISGEEDGYVNPTVRLVDALLVDAVKMGASDVHLEPEGSFLRIRYRIDGSMTQIRSLHKEYWNAIAVRLKILSNMNIAETRFPQDGRINYNVLGRDIDFRVATQPTVHGENIVMRILDSKKSLVPLSKLGFSDHNKKLIKKLLKRPEGIIIVTGPTGSGKTTTLYSVLNYINTIEKNIMTLEDPVEYQLPLIRQSNIREGSGMDFLSGIKSLMRQDPDIIFIGEVRDIDTATMAIRAAMTGHQVFTSLHTNDALGAIPRLRDIGVSNTMLSGSLICVLAQRLIRRLCDECKIPALATDEECDLLGVDKNDPPEIHHPVGCEECGNSGYKGRMGVHEVLPFDKEMDELIATASTRQQMLEHAMAQGFVPILDDGIWKVLKGFTSLEELMGRIDMTSRL